MRAIIGITGASGVIIGTRLADELIKREVEVHVVVTTSGWNVIRHELGAGYKLPKKATLHKETNIRSCLCSSSFPVDVMAVAPCSTKTLSAIANAYTDNVLTRAADGMLRTGKKLVVVPRETPLSLSALENMARLKRGGAIIMPPVAAYYHAPKTVDDMTDFFVGKILDLLGVENELFVRWTGDPASKKSSRRHGRSVRKEAAQ